MYNMYMYIYIYIYFHYFQYESRMILPSYPLRVRLRAGDVRGSEAPPPRAAVEHGGHGPPRADSRGAMVFPMGNQLEPIY